MLFLWFSMRSMYPGVRSSKHLTNYTALVLQGSGEGLEPSFQALASATVVSYMHLKLFATLSVLAKLLGRPIMAAAFTIRDDNGQTYRFCLLLSAVI